MSTPLVEKGNFTPCTERPGVERQPESRYSQLLHASEEESLFEKIEKFPQPKNSSQTRAQYSPGLPSPLIQPRAGTGGGGGIVIGSLAAFGVLVGVVGAVVVAGITGLALGSGAGIGLIALGVIGGAVAGFALGIRAMNKMSGA